MNESGQLEQFIARTQTVPAPEEGGDKGTGLLPRVPFTSNYILTREQEDRLLEHAIKRLGQLEDELGREAVIAPTWWEGDGQTVETTERTMGTFMGKRARFDAVFHNDVTWRPHVLGGIFKDSNLVVPVCRRICRQMISRAQNYFFSTDPWYAAEPEGMEDLAQAEKIGRYTQWKLRNIGSKRNKERAVAKAFILGETVLKTTYQVRDTIFEKNVKVLVDVDGQPIMAQDGDYIFETDTWVDQAPEAGVMGTIKKAAASVMGWKVLERDGVTPEPSAPIWQDQVVKRRQVLFQGPESVPVYYKDFLCPLNAPDVQQADCIVHLYDRPVMQLVDFYVKGGMLDASTPDRIEAVKRTVELIRQLSNNSAQPKSGAAQATNADDRAMAAGQPGGASEPIVEVAEFCMFYDANGDGILENIMVVIDRVNKYPIYYEYIANVTPDGERPYDVVRVGEVDGRWYGEGCMEMFETTQSIADLLVNRWNFSQSRSGRIDFWDPSKTLEGEADPTLKLNWGGTYTTKPNVEPDKVLHSVYLTDIKFEHLQTMIEFFLQLAMNESGVQHANDALVTGQDTQKLATGIRNIEKAGQEIFAPFISDLEPGLEKSLNRELVVLFANLDQEEVFTYLNGDTQGIDTITPEDVKGLKVNVSLLLTRYKGEQRFEQMIQASNVVKEFYSLMPLVQAQTLGFYREMLKSLDAKIDADVILQPLPEGYMGAPAAPVPAGASAAAKPLNPGKSPENL